MRGRNKEKRRVRNKDERGEIKKRGGCVVQS